MLNGWSTRTAQELDPTIRTWGELFTKYQIPVSAYNELYQRAFDIRQLKMRVSTDNVPPMDATLLVSQWTGDWGVQADFRRRDIENRRTLAASSETICPNCDGIGWYEAEWNGQTGMRKCHHESHDR